MMFDSLLIRDFRFIWVSNLCASFAMQMEMVARGWLIYDMTSSPVALTGVMLSFVLPSALFFFSRRRDCRSIEENTVIVVSQILNALATVLSEL